MSLSPLSCLRCSKLAALNVTDDRGGEVDDANVDVVGGGMLTFICPDCLTDEEVFEQTRRSASALLDAAEEAIAGLEMIFNRIPDARNNPEFKAAYAEAQERAREANATLRALLEADDGDA